MAFTQSTESGGITSLQFRVRLDREDAQLRACLESEGLGWAPEEGCYLLATAPSDTAAAIAAIDFIANRLGRLTDALVPSPKIAEGMVMNGAQAQVLERFTHCIMKQGYSPKTIRNYKNAFRSFVGAIGPVLPMELNKAQVEVWLATRKSAAAHQNTLINAIKFYYVCVEGRPSGGYVFSRPKPRAIDPTSLTKGEVQRIVAQTTNLKHRCFLLLTYSSGLRLKEVLGLQVRDIDFAKCAIMVRPAVGERGAAQRKANNAARVLPLSPKLASTLKLYLEEFDPRKWLFEGERNGEPYSERSAQMVVKHAAKRAGLDREISIHMLRNSYATHQLEAGIGVQALQDLMGHGSIRTTGRYAHVARHRMPSSPADDLDL